MPSRQPIARRPTGGAVSRRTDRAGRTLGRHVRPPSTTPPPEVRVSLDAFRHIVQALRLSRADRGQTKLGSAQLFALQQIAEHPNASINDVAALTFTHQSSVSVVIQRLVQQGLVAKVPARDDRRRQRLAVTAKGRRVWRRTPVAAQARLIAAITALPASERQGLAVALNAVARLVAPSGAAPHPPMFFEDDPRDARTTMRNAKRRRR